MSEDMSDIINKFKGMLDSDSMPDNIKNIMNNIKSDDTKKDDISSNISPEMLNTFAKMFSGSGSQDNSNSDSSQTSNFDIETLLKMKTIMEKLNSSKDDSRANLLYSLKPYLRDSRKGKLDQYVKLLNIAKVTDVFGMFGGDKNK